MTELQNQPLLHNKQLSIAETRPDNWDFLDSYQQQVGQMIVYDGAGQTIRGRQPLAYMLSGLDEETHEVLFDADKIEPDYNRFGALVLNGDGPRLRPGIVTETAVARHLKEFGDVAWYLANTLTICGLQYSATIDPGLAALDLKRLANIATGRGDPSFHDMIERNLGGAVLYPTTVSELKTAAHTLARAGSANIPPDTYLKRYDERSLDEEQLVIAAGKYTVLAQHILVNRFDSSYQAALEANIAKLTKRIQNNTVFDKSGGDDR